MSATAVKPRASSLGNRPITTVGKRKPKEEKEAPKRGNRDWPEPVMTIEAMRPQRPWVLIQWEEDEEPERYEVKLLKEFPIAVQSELTGDGEEFDELFAKRGKSNAEKKRLKQILDRMFEQVAVMDEETKAKSDDHVRGQVVTAFTLAPFERAARLQEEQEEKAKKANPTAPSTTDISSLD